MFFAHDQSSNRDRDLKHIKMPRHFDGKRHWVLHTTCWTETGQSRASFRPLFAVWSFHWSPGESLWDSPPKCMIKSKKRMTITSVARRGLAARRTTWDILLSELYEIHYLAGLRFHFWFCAIAFFCKLPITLSIFHISFGWISLIFFWFWAVYTTVSSQ